MQMAYQVHTKIMRLLYLVFVGNCCASTGDKLIDWSLSALFVTVLKLTPAGLFQCNSSGCLTMVGGVYYITVE